MLTSGLYEQVINEAIKTELSNTDEGCKYSQKIDSAEAKRQKMSSDLKLLFLRAVYLQGQFMNRRCFRN